MENDKARPNHPMPPGRNPSPGAPAPHRGAEYGDIWGNEGEKTASSVSSRNLGGSPATEGARQTATEKSKSVTESAVRAGVRAREEVKDVSLRYAEDGRQMLSNRIRTLQNLCGEARRSLEDNEEHALARAGGFLGDQAGRAAEYIESRHPRDMVDDLARLARRNPSAVVGAALAMGFIVGRFALSSSERQSRFEPQRPGGPERSQSEGFHAEFSHG